MYSTKLKLSTRLTEDEIYALGESLNGLAISHSATKSQKPNFWLLEWLSEEKLDAIELTSRILLQAELAGLEDSLDISPWHWEMDEVPDKNWLEECYKAFQPFSVGPFFIHGSHYDGDIPAEQIGMQIDAATAFGSGEHETTKGCLQAMLDLKGQGFCPWNVLDMGTGSGILSVAAWKLWQTPVLGVDMDEEAVKVSTHHAELNDVPIGDGKALFAKGDDFKCSSIAGRKPFELIIANILAEPLREMASGMAEVCDEGAYVILSGMLNDQAKGVEEVYEERGLHLRKKIELGNWTTLVLRKP